MIDHEDARGVWVTRWMIDATRDADGDANLPAALMLGQVTYWCGTAGRDGKPRARHQHHGETWLVRSDEDWREEIGIGTRTAGKARRRLVELGLVESRTLKDDGRPISHLRRLWPVHAESEPPHPAESMDSPVRAESFVSPRELDQDLPLVPAVAGAPLVSWKVPKIVEDGGRLAEAIELCDLMAKSLRDRGHRVVAETSRSKGWVEPMEALLRIDGRDPADVARVLRWLDRGGDDVSAFWRVNVLSPNKLRLHWDRMREQYQRAVGPRPSRTAAALGAGTGPDLADVLAGNKHQAIEGSARG